MLGNSKSLHFRLARDTVGVMVIRVLSMGLSFIVSVVLARLLGVREFGLYSLAMSVLGLLVALATFSFPRLLVREIATYTVKGEWSLIRKFMQFAPHTSLLVFLGIALLSGFTFWLLSDQFSHGTMRVFDLALVASFFWTLLPLHGDTLQGFEKILARQWVSTVIRPLSFLVLMGDVWGFSGSPFLILWSGGRAHTKKRLHLK